MSDRITYDWELYQISSDWNFYERFFNLQFSNEEKKCLLEYREFYEVYLDLKRQIRALQEQLPPHPIVNEATKGFAELTKKANHLEETIQCLVESITMQNILDRRFNRNPKKPQINTPTIEEVVQKQNEQHQKVVSESTKKQNNKGLLHMFIMRRNYKKNATRLISICEDLIEKYHPQSYKPSCKMDLIMLIKARVLKAKDEIKDWKDYDTDYIQIAHTMLAHATFDLLASGKYHLHRGILNPMSCAENIMAIYKASMEYALKKNFIDEETRKEQFEYLLKCISEVG